MPKKVGKKKGKKKSSKSVTDRERSLQLGTVPNKTMVQQMASETLSVAGSSRGGTSSRERVSLKTLTWVIDQILRSSEYGSIWNFEIYKIAIYKHCLLGKLNSNCRSHFCPSFRKSYKRQFVIVGLLQSSLVFLVSF